MKYLFTLLTLSLSASSFASPNSEALFQAMPEAALTVEYRDGDQLIAGAEIIEKASATQVCQKISPLIPNPPANYLCWERIFTGEDAKFTYEDNAEALTLGVLYYADGLPIVGLETKQRGLPSGFCRRQGAVVPKPNYFYSCFNRLP
ncbi:MAG: hypothetical protein EOP11_17535 [Proteobacteria bacterium]|nr:MAG: hypothetical protein EOP11_17535 [Pseudomonadota bacterium]